MLWRSKWHEERAKTAVAVSPLERGAAAAEIYRPWRIEPSANPPELADGRR
jgi:hypothetical protein